MVGFCGTQKVDAAVVPVKQLQEKIEANQSGLPQNLSEKPLIMKSIQKGSIIVYTDSDMMEACGIVDGNNLKVSITDATATAVFCKYEYSGEEGSGWISADTFFENPTFPKEYATVRRDGITVYPNRNYTGKEYQTEQYTGIILIDEKGKKRQVIYDKGKNYSVGWVKKEEYDNLLEYDGRPKQLIADGTYQFHNVMKNNGNHTYIEDKYAQKFTLVHWKNDAYYIIDELGRWMSSQDGKLVWNQTETPEAEGLFYISRASLGYTIVNVLDDTNLSMSDSGKIELVTGEESVRTTWRISALKKMVSLTKPMVMTQYDPAWCGLPYGTDDITGCIGAAACGILAPVNAVYALTGQYMDVLELVDFSVENNYRIIGSGTMDTIFKAIAKKNGENYGFAWDGSSTDIKVLVKKLKKGDVAVSHVDGHYLTIASCSDDGKKFLLLDSNRLPKRDTSAFGDWVDVKRLQEGTLSSTGYFFYKQFDGKKVLEKSVKKVTENKKKD